MKQVIHSHTVLLPRIDAPLDVYTALRKHYQEDQLFLLESIGGPARDCTQSIIAFDPFFTVRVKDDTVTLHGDVPLLGVVTRHPVMAGYQPTADTDTCTTLTLPNRQALFDCLRDIESIFTVSHTGEDTALNVGFFGYFGYDTIFYVEDIKQTLDRSQDNDTVSLSLFRGIVHLDLQKQVSTLTLLNSDGLITLSPDTILPRLVSDGETPTAPEIDVSYCAALSVNEQTYAQWFTKAKGHIHLGDIYQIQLGHALTVKSDYTPFEVYLRLRKYNPSPYMYYTKTPQGVYIIGASPELFVGLTPDNTLTMRPIAGTVRKSDDPVIREQQVKALLADEKERAEHLMLVDLCRNDIARCTKAGSLHVDQLMVTEAYSHVIHIVSNVTGVVDTADKYDVIAATFPAGTMSGTPKIRAMEIIEATERSARGIYAGCIGFFGFNETVLTALCIRTTVCKDDVYTLRASGGIVEDSTATGEWNETISKLSSTYFAITNKELKHEDFIN